PNINYQYEVVPRNCIRLLSIKPGGEDELIACNVLVYSLDAVPSFEAISYTRELGENNMAVSCDGKVFDVFENALKVLKD
ncbi:hypothetical protein M433DRAFT_542515, partial [Acidomyces richmondensis BFW]